MDFMFPVVVSQSAFDSIFSVFYGWELGYRLQQSGQGREMPELTEACIVLTLLGIDLRMPQLVTYEVLLGLDTITRAFTAHLSERTVSFLLLPRMDLLEYMTNIE